MLSNSPSEILNRCPPHVHWKWRIRWLLYPEGYCHYRKHMVSIVSCNARTRKLIHHSKDPDARFKCLCGFIQIQAWTIPQRWSPGFYSSGSRSCSVWVWASASRCRCLLGSGTSSPFFVFIFLLLFFGGNTESVQGDTSLINPSTWLYPISWLFTISSRQPTMRGMR